jgi:hypothetical protein
MTINLFNIIMKINKIMKIIIKYLMNKKMIIIKLNKMNKIMLKKHDHMRLKNFNTIIIIMNNKITITYILKILKIIKFLK